MNAHVLTDLVLALIVACWSASLLWRLAKKLLERYECGRAVDDDLVHGQHHADEGANEP